MTDLNPSLRVLAKDSLYVLSKMGIYKLRRHVVLKPGCQEMVEVWGIDRAPAALPSCVAPHDTDAYDPLRKDRCAVRLLRMADGDWVTWDRIAEWFTEAEAAGYSVISGYENLSPYSVVLVQGP